MTAQAGERVVHTKRACFFCWPFVDRKEPKRTFWDIVDSFAGSYDDPPLDNALFLLYTSIFDKRSSTTIFERNGSLSVKHEEQQQLLLMIQRRPTFDKVILYHSGLELIDWNECTHTHKFT